MIASVLTSFTLPKSQTFIQIIIVSCDQHIQTYWHENAFYARKQLYIEKQKTKYEKQLECFQILFFDNFTIAKPGV